MKRRCDCFIPDYDYSQYNLQECPNVATICYISSVGRHIIWRCEDHKKIYESYIKLTEDELKCLEILES